MKADPMKSYGLLKSKELWVVTWPWKRRQDLRNVGKTANICTVPSPSNGIHISTESMWRLEIFNSGSEDGTGFNL